MSLSVSKISIKMVSHSFQQTPSPQNTKVDSAMIVYLRTDGGHVCVPFL